MPEPPDADVKTNPFGSPTLSEHLLRGVLGIAALMAALLLAASLPLAALALGVLGLVALRGCPTCWTLGLIGMARCRLQPKNRAAPKD